MLIIGGQQISYCVDKHKTIDLYVDYCWQLLKTDVIAKQDSSVLPPKQFEKTELLRGLASFITNSDNKHQNYQTLFQRWLLPQNSPRASSHHLSNERELVRSYQCWFEVGLALDGWFSSKELRKQEQELAQSNYQNPYLAVLLNSVFHKFYNHIKGLKKGDGNFQNILTMELLCGQTIIRSTSLSLQLQPATAFGRYRAAFSGEHSNNTSFVASKTFPLQVLKAPQQYSITDKIITLHDMSEYFGEQQAGTPETAGQWLLSHIQLSQLAVSTYARNSNTIIQVSLLDNEIVERGENRKSLGVGDNHCCRDESAISTLLARDLGLPLCSGHSISVSNILNMVTLWGGANVYELTALSHGLAAFWRLEYRHINKNRSHTLHEVFDIAKNFGVRYQLSQKDNGKARQIYDKINLGYLCQYIDAIYIEIITLLDDVEKKLLLVNSQSSIENRHRTVNLHNNWQQILEEKKHTAKKLTSLMSQTLCQRDEYNPGMNSLTVGANINNKTENTIITTIQEPMYKLLNILKYAKSLAQLTHQSLPTTSGQVAPAK